MRGVSGIRVHVETPNRTREDQTPHLEGAGQRVIRPIERQRHEIEAFAAHRPHRQLIRCNMIRVRARGIALWSYVIS